MNVLDLIGRKRPLFAEDLKSCETAVSAQVRTGAFLVVGGAGSIGQEVVRGIFRRQPRRLDVVDVSENNLVELVRDLRSSLGYIHGEFRTLPLDCGSREFDAFTKANSPYDYVINLSALKHVRSEKDPYTLMRMIDVNILNVKRTLELAGSMKSRKYFAVSSDKAVHPANIMGATKRVMELFLMRASAFVPVSTARFANVAFSDGSLLHGFRRRIEKKQPLSAPRDVRRYFMTPQEAGELCLLSCLLGENRDVFVPRLTAELPLVDFPSIAERFLASLGYAVQACASEEEARSTVDACIARKRWPCYFFDSDTTGEKEHEEFTSTGEKIDRSRFKDIDVVQQSATGDTSGLSRFSQGVEEVRRKGDWSKEDLLDLIQSLLPDFHHRETGKYLDGRM
jgi:FlaA1/EpsC-like NDP-sugar epimerase